MAGRSGLRKYAVWLATLGGIGRAPVAPGTWSSALAALVWFFGPGKWDLGSQIIAILILIPIGVIAAHYAEKSLGHDAHPIVVDEVIGQWIALVGAPVTSINVALGFLLFRMFDIVKPYPIRQSQRLPGGMGVVVDDVLAGLAAAAALLLFRWIIR